ncbi:phosphatase PAP2 family protein [Quadrisphaera sp. DSM 44207]|uniref:phosphatase PAP2 family protein n=1 Tax=Quadrisphaera sp. DSM 44207 TaxID=1881057 RepID=UPI00088D3F2E|nr:phosphatase PAP2 family protein [Quadrisphaera sp. DSM 44207]SDQ04173.1 undecaprenyl-diphosphatase [Quadrisphaera sp. DSM 44207]
MSAATPGTVEQEVARHAGLAGRTAAGAALGALVALPFLALLALVLAGSPALLRLDGAVAAGFNAWALTRPGAVVALEVLAVVAHPWTFRLAVLAVAVALWRRGRRRAATWAVTTTTVGSVLNVVLKEAVERARPAFADPVAAAPGYSFPSGHAQTSMLGAAVLLAVLLPALGRRARALAWSAAALVVLATGFDRVALGVHYLSDVVAGWVVALALVTGALVAVPPHLRR